MQITLPGLGQETFPLPQLPEEDPVPDGAAEGAAEYDGAAEEAAGADEAVGAEEADGADGAALEPAAIELEAAPLVTVTIVLTVTMPPPGLLWPVGLGWLDEAEPCAGLEPPGAAEEAPPPLEPPTGEPSLAQFAPVGLASGKVDAVCAASPVGVLVVTYFPGYGNCTFTDSVVGQLSTSAMLATNMDGNSDISEPSPPVSSVLTQFM